MIWFLMFFSYLFLTFKKFFWSQVLDLNSESIFISSISFLCLFLIFQNFYSFSNFLEKFLFFLIVSLIFFCFLTCDTLMFLLLFESCSYLMIFLIFSLSKDWDKISSVYFMFLMNMVGSIPFMYFIIWMSKFQQNFQPIFLSSLFLFLCFSLILLSKIPIFIFHFWLTKAHVSASGNCSMILASLLLKIGTVGLFKYSLFFIIFSLSCMDMFFTFSIWACLILIFATCRFFDLKYLIACSSVSHMALIFPSSLLLKPVGIFSSFYMMTGHGLISLLLFFISAFIYEKSLNRSFDFNKSIGSLSGVILLFFFLFFLMNLGFPPFLNFFSELYFYFLIYDFSYSCATFYFFVLFSSVLVFMTLVVKILAGNKNFYFFLFPNVNLNLNFVFMGIFLLFLSFYYWYIF